MDQLEKLLQLLQQHGVTYYNDGVVELKLDSATQPVFDEEQFSVDWTSADLSELDPEQWIL